jgi:hypothetical protein
VRSLIEFDPFAELPSDPKQRWMASGRWPARWIRPPLGLEPPHVVAYRCRVHLERARAFRVHVSADERYELYVDGRRIGRGPERGSRTSYFFETYALDLTAGDHVFVARVFTLSSRAPLAQVSVANGFLLCPDPDSLLVPLLATGVAPWESLPLDGFDSDAAHWSTGASGETTFDGRVHRFGFEHGLGDGYELAITANQGASAATTGQFGSDEHLLRPAPLPAMLERPYAGGRVRHVSGPRSFDARGEPFSAQTQLDEEVAIWQAALGGGTTEVKPHCRRRLLVDLEEYVCAYVAFTASGGAGAKVRVRFAEALYADPAAENRHKQHRDTVLDRFFHGIGDTFVVGGGERQRYETWWWRAGRYVELMMETLSEPLVLEGFELTETRYPLEAESALETSDDRLPALTKICVRALEACCHETYQDCPYYEQLQWVGDTRTQMLLGYVLTLDDRPQRKSLDIVRTSREVRGLTSAHWPSRGKVHIPGFSLWWVASVYDLALFRGHRELVRGLMPDVRGVLDAFLLRRNEAGLVVAPPGWCFTDWADGWHMGTPPDGESVSGLLNYQLIHVLGLAARLETWLDEPELAERARRYARELGAAAGHSFFDEPSGRVADDLARSAFSEHTQALALLSGSLDEHRAERVTRALVSGDGLTRARMFFSHWVFEALVHRGRADAVLERMEPWYGFVSMGYKTTPEHDDAPRSDCHAWGAHPLYHLYTGVAGIEPASFGFGSVRIAPALGKLEHVRARMVHPRGFIRVELERHGGALRGTIELPAGLPGVYVHAGREQRLEAGVNLIR